MFKKSKIIVGAALLAVSVLSFTLPQQAEAINLGSIAGKAVPPRNSRKSTRH